MREEISKMTRFYSKKKAALLASTLILPTQVATAQTDDDSFSLEEIVVTAQKRSENLQDVPVSVQVLGNAQLENLNVNGFDDYIKFLPTVSYVQSRPGVAQIYMRGIASGGDGNHSASMPSVGVYLDEQPITTINEILDLHMYDIARVETLSGPQGTLFGASSQSGTLRIITNKPVIGESSFGYDVSIDSVKNGEMGWTLEGVLNLPVAENAAMRLVAWHESDGGYIDNVPSELTFGASGITINNFDIAEEDHNDIETTGARAMLKIDLNENWTVSPGVIYQEQSSTGTFNHDPDDVGDLQASRFVAETYDESWYQASMTVEGKIAGLDVIYAASYLDRERDSVYDYTGYSEYLEDLYAGYGYDSLYYDANGDPASGLQFVTGDETFNRQSHEFRLQSPDDKRVRFIAGLFYQRQKHDFDLRWTVPAADPGGSVVPEDPNTVVWQTSQVRIDRDKAAFGEVAFDISDKLTLTAGIRFFEFDNTLQGFNGFLRHCTGFTVDGEFVQDNAGTPQFPCVDTNILDGRREGTGQTYKVNLTYQIDDDKMVYATYSEGFRPGGVNRARVPNIPGYDPDWVYNYEVGFKTSWLDNRLRFNGAIYHIDWNDIQFSFLDFTVSNLTIIQNVGGSKTDGFEFDLDFAASEKLTLSFSASYNDAALAEDYFRNATDTEAKALKGQQMPFAPKLQYAASARYTEDLGGLPAFAQLSVAYTGRSWSDLELDTRENQRDYYIVNLSAGIDGDDWSLGIFADNLFDERAEIRHQDPGYPSALDTTTQVNRPRTLGIRFGQKF